MRNRVLPCLAALVLLFTLLPAPARAVDTSAHAAILLDATTGEILYEKNPDEQLAIASITKIVTALTAVKYGSLEDTVTVSRKAAGTEGSSMYLKAGEKLTLHTLLYGLLMRSGNDAAVAIAEHVGGSESAFVALMNQTARELGMFHSSFANPHGLTQTGHYSSARDMAVAANAAMDNETIRRITSTRSITIGGRTMNTQNKLLDRVEGCIGLKTGYTKAAGRTLVSCVERDGHRLICVTLRDSNDWADHEAFYQYGFERVSAAASAAAQAAQAEPEVPAEPVRTRRLVTSSGAYCGEAKVADGVFSSVPLMAAQDFWYDLADSDLVEVRMEVNGPLSAPVWAGDRAGTAVYTVNGTEAGRVDLLCSETIAPRILPGRNAVARR